VRIVLRESPAPRTPYVGVASRPTAEAYFSILMMCLARFLDSRDGGERAVRLSWLGCDTNRGRRRDEGECNPCAPAYGSDPFVSSDDEFSDSVDRRMRPLVSSP